jgi:hypothetical protein
MTVSEFWPGSPPKMSSCALLKADNVCQATEGPSSAVEELEVLLRRFHGGESPLKDVDRSRESRSLLLGADVYEY